LLDRRLGVLDNVMEDAGDHRLHREVLLGQDQGHGQRVQDEKLTRGPTLIAVTLDGEICRLAQLPALGAAEAVKQQPVDRLIEFTPLRWAWACRLGHAQGCARRAAAVLLFRGSVATAPTQRKREYPLECPYAGAGSRGWAAGSRLPGDPCSNRAGVLLESGL